MLGVIEPFAGRADGLCALLWISINKLYGSALVDQLGEGERIPVGKPNAAMRFGFAHVLRLWRAVNSITFGR